MQLATTSKSCIFAYKYHLVVNANALINPFRQNCNLSEEYISLQIKMKMRQKLTRLAGERMYITQYSYMYVIKNKKLITIHSVEMNDSPYMEDYLSECSFDELANNQQQQQQHMYISSNFIFQKSSALICQQTACPNALPVKSLNKLLLQYSNSSRPHMWYLHILI